MTKNLFGPYTFGKSQPLKNRIVMAPMTNYQSEADGVVGEDEVRWLSRRAEGGFGMIVTACAHVREDAKAFEGELGCFSDKHIPGLHALAQATRRFGATPILQIFHGGVRSVSQFTGKQPVAPSAVFQNFPGFEMPRALTEKEIEQYIVDFKDAAVRAQKAGMAGIEIHGANGYLFTQFLSKVTNERSDQWGGSNANRARFLLRVTEEVRKACPPPFIVGVRILAEDSPKTKGFDIDETCDVVSWICDLGVDYIHLSSGDVHAKPWKYPNGETSIARFRKVIPGHITLVASGSVKKAEDGQFALDQGADLVALGKTAIAAPDWPKKAEDPSYTFKALPLLPEQLKALDIGEKFIKGLTAMGLVAKPLEATPPKKSDARH